MFNIANKGSGYSATFLKGYVAGVDTKRSECKVRTENGQTLSGVKWLDETKIPKEQQKVLLASLPNREFYILGDIPIPARLDQKAASIPIGKVGETPSDLANFSSAQAGDVGSDSSVPPDTRVGDKILISDGGAIVGALRAGTTIMKSSATAQLMFSRFDDLGRIVSRNWEHFTDLDSTYKISKGGTVKGVYELFKNTSDARSQNPCMRKVVGNTGGPGFSVTSVFNDDGVETSTTVEAIDGSQHQTTQTGASKVETTRTITGYAMKVHGGDKSNFSMDEHTMHFDVGETTKVDINKDQIAVDVSGGVKITITKSGSVTVESSSQMLFKAGGDFTVECNNFAVKAKGTVTLD